MKDRVRVYNPLTTDFTVTYDVDGTNTPQTFIVPAKDLAYFTETIAQHVKKHLANEILHKRGVERGSNPEADLKNIMREISYDDINL